MEEEIKEEILEPGTIDEQPQESTISENNSQKKPKPKWLQKIIDYLRTHEDMRQAVMFFLFSCICGGTQAIITLVLPMILRAADSSMSDPIVWFIFDYSEKGVGEFIGFLVGSVIGQILTFVLNRKKTFNVSDHIPFRAIAYAVMAVLIILMQTALGGVVTTACGKAYSGEVDLAWLFNLTGQAVAGISALIVNFLGNKFFVMRKFKSSKD